MRSFLLILATVAVLGGAFAAYWLWQPTSALLGGAGAGRPDPQALRSQQGRLLVGPGDEVVVRSYDKATGRLTTRFGAYDYAPQPNGEIKVTRPVVEFYLRDGQVVRVRGEQGMVFVPEGPEADASMTSSSAKPGAAASFARAPTR